MDFERRLTGDRIQAAREVRGLCIHEFADQIGQPIETVRLWESMDKAPIRESIAAEIRRVTRLPARFFQDPPMAKLGWTTLDLHHPIDPDEPCCTRDRDDRRRAALLLIYLWAAARSSTTPGVHS